jgi:hypothetical protein
MVWGKMIPMYSLTVGAPILFMILPIDTMTFINLSAGVNFTFLIGSAKIADEFGNVVTTDGNIENFTGTNFPDNFIFTDGASIFGVADGQGGRDTLNYSAFTSVGMWF